MTACTQVLVPGGQPALTCEVGHGEDLRPLVLLHGASADSTSWAPVTAHVCTEWRTYALDFRGHGRSDRAPGRYRLDDYVNDADRLLHMIGQPAVVVGHSLGAIVAAVLAQACHPLVTAVFLEDPPLYVVDAGTFPRTGIGRGFAVLREHILRLQSEHAPLDAYRELLAASPHPAGDRLADHLHDDALWSRARALSRTDAEVITAVLDGTTFATFDPDRPLRHRALVLRADERYDPAFRPADVHRLHLSSPHAEVVHTPGSGHNIRGDRATRDRYLAILADFLADQPATPLEHQA